MGTVTLPNLNQTGTNEWEDVEGNDRALRDEINGSLDNSNLSASAAIAHSKLANGTAGHLLIANSSGVITGTAISGDITISPSGVAAIASGAIVNADIAAGASIQGSKLANTTVDTAQLATSAVTTIKLQDNAVTDSKIGIFPAVSANRSTNQSIPDSTDTAVTLPGENFDTDSMHSTVTNTSRLTATTAGKYLITAFVIFAATSTGPLRLQIRHQGVTVVGGFTNGAISSFNNFLTGTAFIQLAAGEHVEMFVRQDSGSALNVVEALFTAHWVND